MDRGGHSTLQRKEPVLRCFALTDHRHARGTLALRAAAPAITVDDQGGRRLWIGPDATYWQRELLQRQRPPCRACLLSSRAKEELASSMKGARFASTMRRPVPASRCYCFRAEG